MAKSPARRKPFRVLELGSGEKPVGLIRQAVRAKTAGLRARHFIGVDTQKVNLNKLLKKMKIEKVPTNLKLVKKPAIAALEKMKPNSQRLVFASYLANIIGARGKSQNKVKNVGDFVKAATRVLVPGGRLVLVQDKNMTPLVKETAQNLGLGFHTRELSDADALKSPAKYIRMRATPKRRERMIIKYLEWGNTSPGGLERAMEQLNIDSPEELARPTIFTLRKPRNGEKTIQLVSLRGADLLDDPEIRSAVKGILE